ncbi:MAG: DUF1778 domain-containing protein [Roseomonas sp.]|nr:DUF1778 domain-containing protein [Roseomonas sp.]MCA3431190.1 DUF1778 domain-containing protein [Roseomonas sp.]MCA3435082.1 DUF1778 domain-containing protein [Roseomonas sp.]
MSPALAAAVTAPEGGRIEFRLPAEEKAMLARAAALMNMDLTTFILRKMLPEARAVIENAERLALSDRDSLRVLALLENPPAPTGKLRRAAGAFSNQVESLGGSENAIKQRLGASPVNEGERARSKAARRIT